MSVTTRPQRPARVPAFTLSPSHNNQWLNIHGTHAGAHLGYCRPNADHPENFDIAVVVYAESGANVGGDWIRNVVKNQLNPTIRAALQTAFTRQRSMKEPKGRRPAFKSDKRQELLAYYDDRDPPFRVIKHRKSADPKTHALAILIHPGDLVPGLIMRSDKPEREARNFLLACQRGTATEFAHWRRAGAELAILHRGSCSQYGELGGSRVADEMITELDVAWEHATLLFGDDLAHASKWIATHLDVARRPHIYLAGAYSDPDAGCLTYVGKQLEAIIGANKITVSNSSPGQDGHGAVWRGAGRVENMQWPT